MSLPHPPQTHIHHTEYADGVLRPPSPASSVGTAYGADQTSFSDSEGQASQFAFEQRVLERIGLDGPREEEVRRDGEVLVMVPVGGGVGVGGQGGKIEMKRAWDVELGPVEEKALFDRIMTSLRAEVAQLQENELFEQILLRGSKAALETPPSTNDIDVLMRSMMGPAMNLGANSNSSRTVAGASSGNRRQTQTQAHLGLGRTNSTSGVGIPSMTQNQNQNRNVNAGLGIGLSQPQPQHGAFNFEGMHSGSGATLLTPAADELSGTTIGGKRSRNGTSRRTRNA